MKKITISLVIIAAVCLIFALLCAPKSFLKDTDWTVSGDTVHFSEDTFLYHSGYFEDKGTYKVYTHGPEFRRVKSSLDPGQLEQIQEGTRFVIVVDLEVEDPPEGATTGQQTHFCYFGSYTKDRIVCMEPGGPEIILERN